MSIIFFCFFYKDIGMVFTEIKKDIRSSLPFSLQALCDGHKQGAIFRPEGFQFHQILWVVRGSGIFRVGGKKFLLSEGEGVFTRSGVPHSYEGYPFETAWCTFLMPTAALDYMGIGDYLYFRTPPFLNSETAQLLNFANGDSTPLTRSAAGYTYVVEFFSALLSEKETLGTRIRHLLEQSYAKPLTLWDLSEEFQVDRFTLCHVYKKEKGRGIMEDLARIRIKKAKQLLKYSSDPIQEIAALCGFDSPSYFGKRFRELVGCTPTEYRMRHTS